jgi:hypothetical protein
MTLVYEVLQDVTDAETKEDRIKILKKNESWPLKDIIRGSMDTTVQWNLPTGAPPYTPNVPGSAPSSLAMQHKKFVNFVKGGPGDNLPALRRENLFVEILEAIHPNDAQLVIDMINKKRLKGLTRKVVYESFPGLLKDASG